MTADDLFAARLYAQIVADALGLCESHLHRATAPLDSEPTRAYALQQAIRWRNAARANIDLLARALAALQAREAVRRARARKGGAS